MGVSCCQNANNSLDFQSLSHQQAYLSEYGEQKWPNDQDLQTQFRLSNIYNPSEKIKPLKHKVYDRWFWGTWSNGRPFGVGVLYSREGNNSIYYQGQFNGEPHGLGRVVFNGGQIEYYGLLQKGKANGKGNMINRKQGYEFDGQWKNSTPYIGTLTLYSNLNATSTNKSITENNQLQGNIIVQIDNSKQSNMAIIKYPDGKVYTGQINKTRYIPQGHGQITFINKSKYVGEWNDGEMHGQGKFQWQDGSSYEGQYKFGKKQGIGRFIFASKNYYQGCWLNGKQNGKGVLFDKNGVQLKRKLWKQGIFQGKNNQLQQVQKYQN